MPRYEFKFVLTDVELSKEQQRQVGASVAQAGALALAEHTPPDAVTVELGRGIWWRGKPAPELAKELQEFAQQHAEARGG